MRRYGVLSPAALCRIIACGFLLTLVGCQSANGYAINRSGMRHYARGNYAQARHRFARAVAYDRGNPDYRHNLAMALQKQGDVVGSEKILRHNLTINAMHHPTYHSLAQLMIAQGRAPEAQDLLASWQGTQPYVPEANIEMAWLQRENGDYAGAEQSLRTALRSKPAHPIALAHLGQLYQISGRGEEASAYYQRSLAANWDQPEVQSRLATLQEPGNYSRSAMMQNSMATPILASQPTMGAEAMMISLPAGGTEAMMVSSTTMTSDQMMVSAPSMDLNMANSMPTTIATAQAAMSNPFLAEADANALEDVRNNPAPRKPRKKRSKKDIESQLSAYPLPEFGTANAGWVPTGSLVGQPNASYPAIGMYSEAAPQVSMPMLNAPVMAESIGTPYMTSNGNPTPISQADPAHIGESAPDLAGVPVVDPH